MVRKPERWSGEPGRGRGKHSASKAGNLSFFCRQCGAKVGFEEDHIVSPELWVDAGLGSGLEGARVNSGWPARKQCHQGDKSMRECTGVAVASRARAQEPSAIGCEK